MEIIQLQGEKTKITKQQEQTSFILTKNSKNVQKINYMYQTNSNESFNSLRTKFANKST